VDQTLICNQGYINQTDKKMQKCFSKSTKNSIPLIIIETKQFTTWLKTQADETKNWLKANNFTAKANTFCVLPTKANQIAQVFLGVEADDDFWAIAYFVDTLPQGKYHIASVATKTSLNQMALAWGLAAYEFTRYKKPVRTIAQLVLSKEFDSQYIINFIQAIYCARDLINTPTEDLGPDNLALKLADLSQQFDAKFHQTVGKDLLKKNFPAIHTVGRASAIAPRLLELTWGNPQNPCVSLVGKGVCFDSGGLNLKPANNMILMKKDMGGAAHVIGLAQMIMAQKLPIHLQVLIPAVENAVAGNAYRPGDVINTRKGLTVEIGNTDAEGRLVLADALKKACEAKPDIIIDFATLTGAAKVATGTELPAMFCNHEELANDLLAASTNASDPIWRMPLHQPYRDLLKSQIADLNNAPHSPYGGAITAALFLESFVEANIPWAHFDIMAWNTQSKPGRPNGGEAMGLRAVYQFLVEKYG